jgi:hypothetical protein
MYLIFFKMISPVEKKIKNQGEKKTKKNYVYIIIHLIFINPIIFDNF